MLVIVLSFLSLVLESIDPLGDKYGFLFYVFEVGAIAIFTVEYVFRLWSCTADKRFAHPIKGRLKFAIKFFSAIDLLAILPFYLSFLVPGLDLRALRLFRLLRVFKLLRHFEAAAILPEVVSRKRQELIMTFSLVLVLLLISASLVFMAEHGKQPDKFSNIPAAMWWAVATLSTVGYGDMAPITPLGRILGSVVALLGIGFFALPAGILAQGLNELVEERAAQKKINPEAETASLKGPSAAERRCPHCGRTLQGDESKSKS